MALKLWDHWKSIKFKPGATDFYRDQATQWSFTGAGNCEAGVNGRAAGDMPTSCRLAWHMLWAVIQFGWDDKKLCNAFSPHCFFLLWKCIFTFFVVVAGHLLLCTSVAVGTWKHFKFMILWYAFKLFFKIELYFHIYYGCLNRNFFKFIIFGFFLLLYFMWEVFWMCFIFSFFFS